MPSISSRGRVPPDCREPVALLGSFCSVTGGDRAKASRTRCQTRKGVAACRARHAHPPTPLFTHRLDSLPKGLIEAFERVVLSRCPAGLHLACRLTIFAGLLVNRQLAPIKPVGQDFGHSAFLERISSAITGCTVLTPTEAKISPGRGLRRGYGDRKTAQFDVQS